jgi:hypothetical protein
MYFNEFINFVVESECCGAIYKRRDDRMQVKPGNYLDLLLLGFSCFTLIEDPSEGGKRCSGPGYSLSRRVSPHTFAFSGST